MAPRARNKFGAPMFETEVFRKQMWPTVLKKVLMTFKISFAFNIVKLCI